MILTREAAGQRVHRRTVPEYALESQSQSASVTIKSRHFWTTSLPRLVNVVRECPLLLRISLLKSKYFFHHVQSILDAVKIL
jgi:hypothetical protein